MHIHESFQKQLELMYMYFSSINDLTTWKEKFRSVYGSYGSFLIARRAGMDMLY